MKKCYYTGGYCNLHDWTHYPVHHWDRGVRNTPIPGYHSYLSCRWFLDHVGIKKKTHTDRYLDFDSHHPLAHKIAVARTLLTWADRIYMSMPDRDAEKKHIIQVLNSNGSPTRMIKRNWQAPLAHSPASDLVMPRAMVVIPYDRHVSESIRQILTPLEIRTCSRPHHTLRQTLVNMKNRIPLQQRVGVVYRIPCGTCPRVYVGQTCRMLNHRLKEHNKALTSGNLAQSTIAEHAAHESHVIDWKEAKVVERDVHSSRGTSGQRPPYWTETKAAYHKLITSSSTSRANHT